MEAGTASWNASAELDKATVLGELYTWEVQTSNGDEVVTSEVRNFTVAMLSCALLACQNNGRCVVDEATGAPHCVCPKGFSGERCENNEGDGDVGLVVGIVVPAFVVLAVIVVLVAALLMKRRKKDKVELK